MGRIFAYQIWGLIFGRAYYFIYLFIYLFTYLFIFFFLGGGGGLIIGILRYSRFL